MSVVVADAMSAPFASLKNEERTIEVPVAAPNTGVTNVGVLANTQAPVPVSSVRSEIRFALLGVVAKVSNPVARVIAAHESRSASHAWTLVPITRPNVVRTCEGVLDAHAELTDTMKLSVVAVRLAIVSKSASHA